MNSFLWPLIEDLMTLATTGVPAKRWVGNRLVDFTILAHLVLISGDMPAIAKVPLSVNAVPRRPYDQQRQEMVW